MPTEIKLSQLQDRAQFEQAVAEHVAHLTAFSGVVGMPRPVAHPLVEAAVSRVSYPKADKKPDSFVADYVIINDTPPPPPPLSLEDRKYQMAASLRAAEAAAKEVVMPQRKLRLLNMKVSFANAKFKLIDGKLDDSALTDEERNMISSYKDIQAKYAAIELASAQAESDIEDLTDDTINTWQPPTLG